MNPLLGEEILDDFIETLKRQNELIADTLTLLDKLNQTYNVQQDSTRKD